MAKPTLQELRQRYSQKCYEIGDLEFKLKQIPSELDVVHSQLNVIFKELVKATNEEQKAKPAEPTAQVEIKQPEASL
jgi:hypothetical protein